MNQYMLDIETLSTAPTAAIAQIGFCKFGRESGVITDRYVWDIDLAYYDTKEGKQFTMSGETLKWWFRQETPKFALINDIKEDILLPSKYSLPTALIELYQFIEPGSHIWCHASFDVPILQNAYTTLGLKAPWHYTNVRDIRTLQDLAGIPIPTTTPPATHDALQDCVRQVKYCKEFFNKLKR